MDSQSSSVRPRSGRRRVLLWLLGLMSLLVIGVGWTRLAVPADPKVTAAEQAAIQPRLDDLQAFSLGLIAPVDSRLVEFTETRDGTELNAYAVEYYTVFGIRSRRVDLDCWDGRPGIDGVPTSDGTLNSGSWLGTIWCEGWNTGS